MTSDLAADRSCCRPGLLATASNVCKNALLLLAPADSSTLSRWSLESQLTNNIHVAENLNQSVSS